MKQLTEQRLMALTVAMVLAVSLFTGCGSVRAQETSQNQAVADKQTVQVYERSGQVVGSDEAIKLLKEGNGRYITGNVLSDNLTKEKKALLLKEGQHPFAVVLSCSDSRVPPEILFDQGLGDLFVIRNAGNLVDPVSLGSIEYGAEHLGTPVIVVLGHEKCGAVGATIEGGEAPGSIGEITKKIKPSCDKVMAVARDADTVYDMAIDENILNSIQEIKSSPVIAKLLEEGKVKVVGAKYHMDSGEVTFFEDPITE